MRSEEEHNSGKGGVLLSTVARQQALERHGTHMQLFLSFRGPFLMDFHSLNSPAID